MASDDVWLPIRGYEGLYEISSFGRVRSYKNNKHGLSAMPKIILGGMGKHYRTVVLCDGSKKTFNIHRLVAEHFIENCGNFLA